VAISKPSGNWAEGFFTGTNHIEKISFSCLPIKKIISIASDKPRFLGIDYWRGTSKSRIQMKILLPYKLILQLVSHGKRES
jgi:hypothetical protein